MRNRIEKPGTAIDRPSPTMRNQNQPDANRVSRFELGARNESASAPASAVAAKIAMLNACG